MKLLINSEITLAEAKAELTRLWKKDKYLILTVQKQQRTLTQNAALHVLFNIIARDLNANKMTIKETLRSDFSIPWSSDSVKELIWKEVQRKLYNTESTTELSTDQVNEVFEAIREHLFNITANAEFQIDLEFPSKESQ